ncbi:hypothetical protein ABEG18_15590 [Alsobacter sp. KACC 23698]|uniref:ATPase n=1 Tax=Alsobacter sp. KACC 23698 TaxID=3149229 RepID=A0AAU7JAM0_9HYPH
MSLPDRRAPVLELMRRASTVHRAAVPGSSLAPEAGPDLPRLEAFDPSRDWSETLKLVQAAAERTRATAERSAEWEARADELLRIIDQDRIRNAELQRQAENRVRVAEVRARELERQARDGQAQEQKLLARVAQAEREAQEAEERAKVAEDWLRKLHAALLHLDHAAPRARTEPAAGKNFPDD